MLAGAHRGRTRVGSTGLSLVALQLGLLAVLAWHGAAALFRGPAEGSVALAALLLVASVAVGLWALSANRLGNFNVRPEPRAGGRLVEAGPYRWIRHPMYTAVILFGAACVAARQFSWAWLALAALVAVLVVKARVEERLMLQAHPGYAAYRARTRRFLPWLI